MSDRFLTFYKTLFFSFCIKLKYKDRDQDKSPADDLVMSNVDEELKNLVIEGRQYSLESEQRRRIVTKLLIKLQQSGELNHFYNRCPRHLLGSYTDIYQIAVQKLFTYIWRNLEKYESSYKVLQWINNKLGYFFLDALEEFIPNFSDISIISLDELKDLDRVNFNVKNQNKTSYLSQKVIDIIKEDTERHFENTVMPSHPQINYKLIALQRYEGYSWEEIAAKFNGKVAALSNFYQRNSKKLAPIIRQYLSVN